MKCYPLFFGAILIVLLFAGCTAQDKQELKETPESTETTLPASDLPPRSSTLSRQATTSSSLPTTLEEPSAPGTTTPSKKKAGESCSIDSDCLSGCCALVEGGNKCASSSVCAQKGVSEDECYARQMNWCAGTCQKRACSNCTRYMRCVVSTDDVSMRQIRVERAQQSAGNPGSCVYAGDYEDAAGESGYCGRNKGDMIYAKCGLPPEAKDCAAAYGNPSGYTYLIKNQRAFHAQAGEEYDLWCFMCERAG